MTRRSLISLFAVLLVGVLAGSAWATDSDGDGLSDPLETMYGTNPLLADTDGDTLSDFTEIFTKGTSPKQQDTDADALRDDVGPNPLDNGNHDGGSAPLMTNACGGCSCGAGVQKVTYKNGLLDSMEDRFNNKISY